MEFSFKAIFVSIAGAVLIMIFVNFALQQTGLFEKYSSRAIVNSLEKQLDAFSVSGNSNKVIDLAEETKMNFNCNVLVADDFTKEIGRVIFAPPEIENNKVSAATRVWKFPFKITNFFYLSDENNLHILVFDSGSKEFVENIDLPDFKFLKVEARNFNLNVIKISSIREIPKIIEIT